MAKRQNNNISHCRFRRFDLRIRMIGGGILLGMSICTGSVSAAGNDVPEVEIISVSPDARSANDLVENWQRPKKPRQLTGQQRQAILEQVSGGSYSGTPLLNNIQNQGQTPAVRQLILTVKRPWYVHRAFLSSEGASRVDARSIMRFDSSNPGRAIVGINLLKGSTYLFDFLVDGTDAGTYTLESSSGIHEFADPDGDRDSILVAFEAEQSGWAEFSLRRDAGSFDLHSVEVTLAVAPEVDSQE